MSAWPPKSAAAKLGWYSHAAVDVAVCTLLAVLSARHSHTWAVFPALGRGAGLLSHGAVVWLTLPGGFRERLMEQERARLTAAHTRQ